MASITLTVTSAPNSLTLSGVKSLGAPADIVATAMPTSGQPIALGTMPAQPDGPYVMTTAVPPGSYTVQVSTGTTLASDTKSSSTVAPAILTVAGNNTLGFPADIVVTATPVAGGSPISIGTLANQPVGPYSMTANVPPGEYTVDTAMNVTLTGETTSTSTVSPATLTVTGNNTLGFPADILVTATPSAGGSPITLGTLTKQPVGCYSVTATVPPGDYTVETAMSATLSSEVQSSSSVSPASLTVTGNNTLGFPANIVVTATPAAGGNPITIATLSSQPVGPYSVTAFVPPGDYCVDSAMSVTLSNCVATQSTVAPTVLAVTGNNTLGLPANILVTATPVSGGGSITVGTLTDQPAGPYSLVTDAPPGDYTIDTTISVRLCGDEVASATVAPTVLTATGNNTLGFPADIAVTATPSVGGAPIMIGTLINQPVGAFAVTAVVPPGDYTVAAVLTATLSKPTQTAVCVPQTMLTVTGVKSLGVPADIVAVATPMGSGTPIALGTLCNQPDGPYVITATVPCGDYAVDVTSSATLCAAASCLAAVPAPALLSALITYNGNLYCFDQCSGSNLGNYTDPQGRFVQGCVRSTNVGLPGMTVFFRSDTDGSRDEVVFEYGNPFVTVTPINLTAYTVKITKGGATLATVSVPQHFWFARWRWQSAPRPVTTTPAALITAGLLPHYDASTLGVFAKTSPAYTYTPMTLAGLVGNMSQTGERPDIGPVTGQQADYICVGTNLPTVLAQAEASGTFPWNIRDPNTGAPFDVLANPRASTYSASVGSPYILTATCLIADHPVFGDPAHEPALNYLPYLLTGDPYFLESLQFQATFDVLTLPPASRYTASGAERAFAWSIRNAIQAAQITPAKAPAWLKPQSYWQTVLGNYLTWLTTQMNRTDPLATVFATITNGGSQVEPGQPAGTYFTPWQDDFLAFVLCWAAGWYPAWMPAATWKIQSSIARANGTSGWLRAHPSPYYIGYQATTAGPEDTSWFAAYARNVASHPGDFPATASDPTNNNQLDLSLGANVTYPSYQRGALAFGNRIGIANTAVPFAWLDREFVRQVASNRTMDRKWMVT